MIKLIAIDMDGTLLNEHNHLNQATIDAVHQATAQGIKVVLCTGRPKTGVNRFLEPLGLTGQDSYVITFNGAVVQTATGDVLLEYGLTLADYQRLYNLAEDLGVHVHVEDADNMYTANRAISKWTVRESFLVDMPLFYRLPTEFPDDKQFTKVMMVDDPDVLAKAQAKIPAAFHRDYYLVHSEPFFLEALNPHASKGNAVMHLADRLGIAQSEVMAIGDQANDLPMIEQAGLGVAMGNAIPVVQDSADVITATNKDDGVAKAIHRYALTV